MADFQELADEAFRDLLAKHGRPLGLKDQLKLSLRRDAAGEDAAPRSRKTGSPVKKRRR
jgi:hypothetical protein